MKSKRGVKRNLRPSITQKITRRQLMLVASMGIIIPAVLFTIINVSKYEEAYAANGDFRSKASGVWGAASTWQKYNNGWVNAVAAPTSADGEITIQNGHTVTVATSVTVDQVEINSGGILILNSGRTLTLAAGIGTDLYVSGCFNNAGTVTINSGATISYQSGGKYQHNFSSSSGTIPTATWNNGSTCEILNVGSSTVPGGMSQSFHHFTWNATAQNADVDLAGALTTVNGDFTFASSGTKETRLASNASTLNVGGNFSLTGGKLTCNRDNDNADYTINVGGNFNMSGGTFNTLEKENATLFINLSGNWNYSAGTIEVKKNTSNIDVIFKKNGVQNFSASANSIIGNIDYTVKTSSTLAMGTNIVRGRKFTVESGGGLQIGSPNGLGSLLTPGNIQVTGTKTFHAGGNYIYNGTAAQVTGTNLPATISGSLEVNNTAGLTLSATTNISGTLKLTNGCITQALLTELNITNTSPSAISGGSSTSYVKGSLKRSVLGSGTYEFPIGTNTNYEYCSVTLSGTTGFSNLTATFNGANPLAALLPLANLAINGLIINRILNGGYWTLSPNSAMTGGTYSVKLKEKGHATPTGGRTYCVLKRTNSLAAWQSIGIHDYTTQSELGGIVTAVRSGLTSFSDFAVGYGEYLAFKNPELVAGVAGQVGAIYDFSDVATGIDAWVEILELRNGATLNEIDNFNEGYDEAWQPFINAAGNTSSDIRWRITFKVAGTSRDTVLQSSSLTAVDVDGGSNMREWIEATSTYSYSLDPSTVLTVTQSGNAYRATGSFATINDIDTAHHEAMAQMNFRNVSTFTYRTGVTKTSSGGDTRQFSLYFGSFLSSGVTSLPVNLLYFNAFKGNGRVDLKWSTASEKDNDYFTVERSIDGVRYDKILTVPGAGTSVVQRNYSASDKEPVKGVSYYRLKQTDYNGKFTYSDVKKVTYDDVKAQADVEIRSVVPSAFNDHFTVNFSSKEAQAAEFILTSINGQVIDRMGIMMEEGNNYIEWTDVYNMQKGIYLVIIATAKEKSVMKIMKQ